MKDFALSEKAQVSLEFILLVGGVLVAALTIVGIRESIKSLANVTSDWVEQERNLVIEKVTR